MAETTWYERAQFHLAVHTVPELLPCPSSFMVPVLVLPSHIIAITVKVDWALKISISDNNVTPSSSSFAGAPTKKGRQGPLLLLQSDAQ